MFRFAYLILFILLTASVRASTNDTLVVDYVPFLDGQPWPRVPVTIFVETGSNIWVHPSDPKHFPSVQETHEADADFTTVVIRFPTGTVYKTYNSPGMGPYLSAVYMGDFNNDGISDFMAIKPGGGCGLAGEYRTGIFAFSEGSDYCFTRITSMGLGPHDLVVDPKTRSFRLIHTSFRSGKSLDGEIHSFWVHRFYKWENRRFQSDADLPPLWIQYLSRPNHEVTKLLTPDLKAKAWADDPESEPRIGW